VRKEKTLASPAGRCTLARASPHLTQNMRFRSVAPCYTHICQRSPFGHIIPLANIAYSGTLDEIVTNIYLINKKHE